LRTSCSSTINNCADWIRKQHNFLRRFSVKLLYLSVGLYDSVVIKTLYTCHCKPPQGGFLVPNSRVRPLQYDVHMTYCSNYMCLDLPLALITKFSDLKKAFHLTNRTALLDCGSTWSCFLDTNCCEKH